MQLDDDYRHFTAAWRERLLAAISAAGLTREEVAKDLGLSVGPFYKRCSGRTEFSVAEFAALSARFHLPRSLQELRGHGIVFYPSRAAGRRFDRDNYLEGLRAYAARFAQSGGRSRARLRLLTSDLPIFWLLANPTLAALKLYLWERLGGRATDFGAGFDCDTAVHTDRTWLTAAGDIARAYATIDSEEVWGPYPLRSFYDEVRQLVERRDITLECFELIAHQFAIAIDDIRRCAASGRKSGGGTFSLRRNGRQGMSATGALKCGSDRSVFLTFDSPNHLTSAAPSAGTYFDQHFESVFAAAEPVSLNGRLGPRRVVAAMERGLGDLTTFAKTQYEAQSGAEPHFRNAA